MPSAPTVSVVIPTHDRRAGILRAVDAALQDDATVEVIVVVDGSHDGSYEMLKQVAERDARLRPFLIENRGEMGARRYGAERARGDVVLFLDDDVVAAPGLAARHARRHDVPGRVVVGYMPSRLPARRRPGDFATYLYADEYEHHCRLYEQHPERVLRSLWAGNLSLHRRDALTVGLDSGSYVERYHPDREFGLRCLKAGLVGVFDRSLRAEHRHERTLAGFVRDARSQGAGRAALHELHRDVLGPQPRDAFELGLPAPAAAAVRLARRPRIAAVLARTLRAAVRMAGAAQLFELETAFAKLLRRVEQQRGASAWTRASRRTAAHHREATPGVISEPGAEGQSENPGLSRVAPTRR